MTPIILITSPELRVHWLNTVLQESAGILNTYEDKVPSVLLENACGWLYAWGSLRRLGIEPTNTLEEVPLAGALHLVSVNAIGSVDYCREQLRIHEDRYVQVKQLPEPASLRIKKRYIKETATIFAALDVNAVITASVTLLTHRHSEAFEAREQVLEMCNSLNPKAFATLKDVVKFWLNHFSSSAPVELRNTTTLYKRICDG